MVFLGLNILSRVKGVFRPSYRVKDMCEEFLPCDEFDDLHPQVFFRTAIFPPKVHERPKADWRCRY